MASRLLKLPPEQIEQIGSTLPANDLFNFRPINTYVQRATIHTYRTILQRNHSFDLNSTGFDKLAGIASTPVLARGQKFLVFECRKDRSLLEHKDDTASSGESSCSWTFPRQVLRDAARMASSL